MFKQTISTLASRRCGGGGVPQQQRRQVVGLFTGPKNNTTVIGTTTTPVATSGQVKSLRVQVEQRRFMGGDGGHFPVPQSATAEFLGGKQKVEGWENTFAWWYASSFIILVLIINTSPDTTIEAWAEKEARARLALKAKGFTDFQFGTHYSSLSEAEMKRAWESVSLKTSNTEEDDE